MSLICLFLSILEATPLSQLLQPYAKSWYLIGKPFHHSSSHFCFLLPTLIFPYIFYKCLIKLLNKNNKSRMELFVIY